MSGKEIEWDLTEIFAGCDDPEITKTMEGLTEKVDEIVKIYKGKINVLNFTAQDLHDLLEKVEEIYVGWDDLDCYSYCSFNANTNLPEAKALLNKYRDFQSTNDKKLAFLAIEIGGLVNENPQIINKKILSNYKYYLEKTKKKFPFELSEKEEKLIIEKDQYGSKAWEQLRSTWISTRKFKATIEGKEELILYNEFIDYTEHPDRETRISVNKSVYTALMQDKEIYSSALRNICADRLKTSNRRGYDSPLHQSLIYSDITKEIIDNLMITVEDNIDIYQKFLKIKTRLLNLSKLDGVDIFAYLPSEKNFTWDELKELNLQVYNKFDSSFGEIVHDMIERNHIDLTTKEGKIAGYCYPWFNGKSAFISLSYTGLFRDIVPLIHEIGHGIHDCLASREQSYLNFYPSHLVCETGSIFGELLLTDFLLETTESTQQKITLLTNLLNMGGSIQIFLMSRWFWFEQSLYDAIEKGEYMDSNTISKYWCAARDKICGNSVEWFDEMKLEWITVPHFFMAGFYNYPYIYGQLFVYALYQTYKNEGKRFVPKFKKLLSAGCSLSPKELGKIVGLDVTTPDIWKLGMNQFESFVNELEKLIN